MSLKFLKQVSFVFMYLFELIHLNANMKTKETRDQTCCFGKFSFSTHKRILLAQPVLSNINLYENLCKLHLTWYINIFFLIMKTQEEERALCFVKKWIDSFNKIIWKTIKSEIKTNNKKKIIWENWYYKQLLNMWK